MQNLFDSYKQNGINCISVNDEQWLSRNIKES